MGLIFSVPKDWKVELEDVGDVLFQSYQKIMDWRIVLELWKML
jgi:hypothetical protein